jgi:hypothetical protein
VGLLAQLWVRHLVAQPKKLQAAARLAQRVKLLKQQTRLRSVI